MLQGGTDIGEKFVRTELAVQDGAADKERGPLRRCIATGESRPVGALLRFVVGPDDTVVPDLAGTLPGRGIWVTADRAALDRAVAKGLFRRAARRPVHADADLSDRVAALLARRMVDLVSMARRAGQAVAGFEKVRAWLKGGRAGVLLEAADGALDGRAKLRALAPQVPVVDLLRAAELGAAFGRERAVHVVLAPGGLATKLNEEAARLAGFRSDPTADAERG